MLLVVSFAQVDTLSSKTRQPKKLDKKTSRICSNLGLPYNEEANLDLLNKIKEWEGVKYCFGGNTKKCIDCSGFTSIVYQDIYKKVIPRVSRDIYSNSMPIKKNALYEGDLVFFATKGDNTISHVGIYLWDGYFAHASSSKGVTVSNLRSGYYMKTFVSGGAWID
jgi:cell wall-associated NlpC family hydrolase